MPDPEVFLLETVKSLGKPGASWQGFSTPTYESPSGYPILREAAGSLRLRNLVKRITRIAGKAASASSRWIIGKDANATNPHGQL